jgi:RND family efflux transporter MFP subunit
MAIESTASADLQRLQIPRERRGDVLRRRSILPWVIFLLVAGGAAGGFYWYWSTELAVPIVTTARAVMVTPGEGNAVLTASGYIVAQRKAILGAKSPRKLVERFVGEGDRVEANQIVARLDHIDVDARMDQARAGVVAATAMIERARTAITRAEQELVEAKTRIVESKARRDGDARELKRYQDAEKAGAGVRKDRELAETALAVSNASLATAEQKVKTAEANLDWMRKDLAAAEADLEVKRSEIQVAESAIEDTKIRSPFAGVILLKQAEVGESVSPGVVSGQVTSGAIFQVADFDTLEAEVDINEANLSRVHDKQPTEVQVDAIPNKVLRGEVRLLMPGANRQKATVAAKVTLLDKDARLKPEMGCKVIFLREASASQAAPKLLVPVSAIRRDGSQSVVFALRNGALQRRPVETGEPAGDRVEIRSGLAEGDEIVVSAPTELKDGMAVRLR